jgi:hypothetical protein
MTKQPAITPESITLTVVTVRCPRCDLLHQYSTRELKPWPINPGAERTVVARCVQIASNYARAGHYAAAAELTWSPGGARTFTIKFE